MKKLSLRIRPRGDGKYSVHSEWGWGWWRYGKAGLTEEELIQEVVKQIRGTLREWEKK